jgi:hypothetical protein
MSQGTSEEDDNPPLSWHRTVATNKLAAASPRLSQGNTSEFLKPPHLCSPLRTPGGTWRPGRPRGDGERAASQQRERRASQLSTDRCSASESLTSGPRYNVARCKLLMLVKFCAPERGSTPRRGREAGAPRRSVCRSLFLSFSLTGGPVGSLWPAVNYLRVRGLATSPRNTLASTPSHHPAQHLIPPCAPNPNLSPFPVGRRLLPPRAFLLPGVCAATYSPPPSRLPRPTTRGYTPRGAEG